MRNVTGALGAALLVGCSGTAEDVGPVCSGAVLRDGDTTFSRPFPSDDLRVDGRPSYAGFPRSELPLVQSFLSAAERHTGWSPYGTLYLPLQGPVDTELLPASRADSIEADSLLQLVDVTEGSPTFEQPLPIGWRMFEDLTSMLLPHTLAVRPMWGRGLRPDTTYELRVDPRVACGPGRTPTDDRFGVIVRITTGSPTDLLGDMVSVARGQLPASLQIGGGFAPVEIEVEGGTPYVGSIQIPRWQEGDKPYTSEGGDVRFEDGLPVIDGFDEVPIALVVPDGTPPAQGWSAVLFMDGTGSTHENLLDSGIGAALAEAGMVSLSIDLPLHGARGVGQDPTTTFVNINNPIASVMSSLQGAADQVYLADLLSRPGASLTTPDGPVPIRADRVGYLGHSQGGITGALAAGYFDGSVQAMMLSGTGGGVLRGALLNQAGVDVRGLLATLFGFVDGEELDDYHPIGTVIQHAADHTDPLHVAPHWFAEAGTQSAPLPAVFLSQGLDDDLTPPVTTQAMAHAGGVAIAGEVAYEIAADRVFPPDTAAYPISGNAVAFDGADVTAGLVQYPRGGHFVAFRTDFDRVAAFLASALLDGRAVLEDSP
ncbi:MAG: hypothetical protein KTR31_24325 [Myxococcales bacterium]|nr:hypothetical protein [Myxococcales bacterium]